MNTRTVAVISLFGILSLAGACSGLMPPQDDLARKVDYLRADVEKLTAQQAVLLEEVRELRGGTALTPVSAPVAAKIERLEPVAVVPPKPAIESGDLSGDPGTIYQKGYDLLGSGQVEQSQAAFAEFIRRFPESDLADNAQYWIGEGFYSQKAFQEARDAFQGVVDHFPFGNKVPDALYKRALCEGELGNKAAETKTLREVVEQYPFSDASAKARDLLKKLG